MTFSDFLTIYEVFGKLAEDLKQEAETIRKLHKNDERWDSGKDPIYQKIRKTQWKYENICSEIENREI